MNYKNSYFILIFFFIIILLSILLVVNNELYDIKKCVIVISRYLENLNFMDDYPFNKFNAIVYNKGNNDNFNRNNVIKVVNLPNIGRNDHTFIYHIVNEYNNLSENTIFITDSINLLHKKTQLINIIKKLIHNNFNKSIFISKCICENNNKKSLWNIEKNFFMTKYGASGILNKKSGNNQTIRSNISPFGKWYFHNFNNLKDINNNKLNINYKCNAYYGIIGMNKKNIINKDINFYKKLLKQLEIGDNVEVGHYIERSWSVIFAPLADTEYYVNTMTNIKDNCNKNIMDTYDINKINKTIIYPGLIYNKKIVCIYAYYENKNSKNNLIHFLKYGINNIIDYYIVINESDFKNYDRLSQYIETLIKNLDNITIIRKENKGFDFGAYNHVIKNYLTKKYDYYIFLNGSIKGPTYKYKDTWLFEFIKLFNNDVKLVGTTINMFNHDIFENQNLSILYGNKKIYSHIQSMFFILNSESFDFLYQEKFFDDEYELNKLENTIKDKNYIIYKKEFGLSQLILNKGWNINCYLEKYRNIDYRIVDTPLYFNPITKETDVYYNTNYFGNNITENDVIFIKNNR